MSNSLESPATANISRVPDKAGCQFEIKTLQNLNLNNKPKGSVLLMK